VQTPKELLAAADTAVTEEHLHIVTVLAELEHAAVAPVLSPIAKIDLLFRDFLPQIIAIAFIALVFGGSLGVSIGKHLH
jgi:hypothetical protein